MSMLRLRRILVLRVCYCINNLMVLVFEHNSVKLQAFSSNRFADKLLRVQNSGFETAPGELEFSHVQIHELLPLHHRFLLRAHAIYAVIRRPCPKL